MPRKFSTTILDTLLKTVEVEFKVPLLGFGEIRFPVSEYAKEWWKNEKAREDLLNAIDIAEQKFIAQNPENKAAQILHDFSLKNEEDFQKVIAELLNHLDEQKITWLMADKLGKGFERIVSNKELQSALSDYIPYLQDELSKIREFREVISYLLQKQIAKTTSLTYETTQEIKGILLERQTPESISQPTFIPETFTNPDKLPEPSDFLPPGSRMPFYRNKVFTGREADLLALAQSLVVHHASSATAITQTAAATGMGGIGKTQLAVEFCYCYGRYFHGTHWIDARQSIETEIAVCGLEMGLPNFPEATPDRVILTLREWQKEPQRLLVLDSLEDPKILNEWLPKFNNLRILVTTRRQQWSADLGMDVRRLDTLQRSESIVLLRKLAKRLNDIPDDDLNTLGANLGDLPLALALAGTYLNKHNSVTVSGYLKRLEKEGLQALDELGVDPYDLPTRHDAAISATLRTQWQSLENVTAQRILQVIASVGEKVKITRSRLGHLVGSNNKFVVGYPNPIEDSLRLLYDFSLIEEFSESRLSVHLLITKFVETTIPEKETFLKLLFDVGVKENPPLNVYMYWALTAKEQGDIEKARRLFEYGSKYAFSDAPTYQAWAIMEKEQKEIDRARELFALAVKADANNAPTYQAWAIMEKEQKNIKRARELFALAVQADPNHAPVYNAWAIMEKEQKEIDRARELFALVTAEK